ncbi:Pin-related site-specific recombinase/DNA invertase [Bacillus pseudomycoides]|uniref:recombinase family protein n=1 Tax=Bacillus pseudomycoides TaxID=64104 RepID=UPI000BF80019|nr:recombinase family protein [Bacillus pseudomycoides]MCR8861105.1 recombinase family protein [Bacillus pseudomycoides]PFX40409.1 Pin-related site-specific recombinase/DNA invertase [Bacillus pseudomycoides]PFY13913.1 Pin-related site-specific recombinase/DNA invertase [Bacillus pseudomycoides]
MTIIGYARKINKTQNLDRQIEALKDVSKMFVDKMSGQSMERSQHLQRPQLKAMLNFIREGDIVVITELDQLSRNNKDLIKIMNDIQRKGAALEVLNLPSLRGIEDENVRRLINNLIIELYRYQDYQDESERQRTKEKQAQGISMAKKQGKFKGGKPKYEYDNPNLQQAFKLYLEGETENHIEKVTGINRRTFRRYREKYNVYRQKENS